MFIYIGITSSYVFNCQDFFLCFTLINHIVINMYLNGYGSVILTQILGTFSKAQVSEVQTTRWDEYITLLTFIRAIHEDMTLYSALVAILTWIDTIFTFVAFHSIKITLQSCIAIWGSNLQPIHIQAPKLSFTIQLIIFRSPEAGLAVKDTLIVNSILLPDALHFGCMYIPSSLLMSIYRR